MYCYEVWLKHLTYLAQANGNSVPKTVAELGPGDSLGIGLAALLAGANQYYALDVVTYSNVSSNVAIFDSLIDLYKRRTGRPKIGWPDYDRYLDSKLFPSHILTEEVLANSLDNERLDCIRYAILNPGKEADGIIIEYLVPWASDQIVRSSSVDFAFSHAVFEHVVDLGSAYAALHNWLRPGAVMSHQIDFTSHGLSEKWNGYRAFPEWLWRLILGRRPYLINREPYSVHRNLIIENGFDITCELLKRREDGIRRSQLAERWQHLSDDDLSCSGAFVQARKLE
jgi:hypothetical protein